MSPQDNRRATRPAGQREGCPHTPHDHSCGPLHGGLCALEHPGGCEAVHPICPACYAAHPGTIVRSVAAAVAREGIHFAGCSECEQRTFQYDADLFCRVCRWFVPDVNEKLAERYAAQAGSLPLDPGKCPGCHVSGAKPAISFPFQCSVCGSTRRLNQRDVPKTGEVSALCDECGGSTRIPTTIWCPECQLNLRNLTQITELIEEANEVQAPVGDNVKEPPLDQVARRVGALATASERRFRSITEVQQNLIIDPGHLDIVLFSDGRVEEWILDAVKLRSIGYRLHREGGMRLMQDVHARVSVHNRGVARSVDMWWDKIGDWQS